MGFADRAANGINTVRLSYVREKTGRALIGRLAGHRHLHRSAGRRDRVRFLRRR
jgi:hypothetical protein